MLGKLSNGLDIVAQRLPGEIFSMVDTTLEEVADRAEYGRRGSVLGSMGTGSSVGKQNDILILSPVNPSTLGINTGTIGMVYTPAMIGLATSNSGTVRLSSVNLRLAALESSHKQIDQDILRDFFWTLYSKLDAVAQGLRVVYEVANRIGSVSSLPHIPIKLFNSNILACVEAGLPRFIRNKTWFTVSLGRGLDAYSSGGMIFVQNTHTPDR